MHREVCTCYFFIAYICITAFGKGTPFIFQIADYLIDYSGDAKKVGKRTRKDKKKGKATLISLLGYEKTIKYVNSIKLKLINKFENYGSKSKYINETINYILSNAKWKKIINI